jgi:hypothetical protein
MMSKLFPSVVLLWLLALPCGHAQNKSPRPKPAKIKFSEKRGLYDRPITVELTAEVPDVKLYFTTDGSEPTPARGQPVKGPLRLQTTTVLRAAGYRENQLLTELDTHTYLFVADVPKQTGASAPATWGTNQNERVPADYEMDQEIVGHPAYRSAFPAALRALPSFSVVLDPNDLFAPDRGLYSNPRRSGEEWERKASVELLPFGARKGFQIDCGLRIQGGWNRRPEESPKHSFRLAFRKKYGAGNLDYPLFAGLGVGSEGTGGPTEFESLILRAGCNNTWLHWNSTERKQGDYLRDQWMRDSYAAMGHPSARGLFVHLYLNGLYWGIYNLTERPDEHFAAAHGGGKAKDYDARNGENVLSGDENAWKKLFVSANAGFLNGHELADFQALLDLPAFIDFMILNHYGANNDWDHASNWYAARRRQPASPFLFFIWDGERTLESVEANTLSFDDDFSPPRLFHKLSESPEFRVAFGDRVHRHLAGRGALAPETAAQRFRVLSQLLDSAIVAESARWGDYRRDVHRYKVEPYELYTRDDHWRPEIQRLLTDYFPRRTAVLLKQFQEAELYPRLEAPVSRIQSGHIVLSAPSGAIYFTEDGTDPRLPGGALSAKAQRYQEALAAGGQWRARARLEENGHVTWSALVQP